MEKEKINELIINAQQAFEGKNLLKSSFENISEFLNTVDIPDRFLGSINELFADKRWEELNIR